MCLCHFPKMIFIGHLKYYRHPRLGPPLSQWGKRIPFNDTFPFLLCGHQALSVFWLQWWPEFFSPGLRKKQTIVTTNNSETQSTQRVDGVDIIFPFSVSALLASPVHCCWIHPAWRCTITLLWLLELEWCMMNHWGRWLLYLQFMFFPYWRPVDAPGTFCPSEEGRGRDGGRVRGTSQRTATRKISILTLHLLVLCLLFFFFLKSTELNIRGVYFRKPCSVESWFSYLWAVQPSVPISSRFPVIFILPFIKINMRRNHIFY